MCPGRGRDLLPLGALEKNEMGQRFKDSSNQLRKKRNVERWAEETRMRWRILTAAALAAGATACASYSEKIPATYVSPVIYENLSCRQIAEEASRVSRRAAEVAGVQDSQATRDSVVTGVAIVVFWPAAFFVGGDRGSAAELGRLKGEMDALEQASVKKNCGIQFRQSAM